jgi:hypothetical protein
VDNDNIINYKLYVPSICIYIYMYIYMYIYIHMYIYRGRQQGEPPSHMMGMFECKALKFKMIN